MYCIKSFITSLFILSVLASQLHADVFSKAMYTWPAGIIAYSIDDDISEKNRETITQAISYYNELTNLNFVEIGLKDILRYPNSLKFTNSDLIAENGFYNLCDIGASQIRGVRFARIPSNGLMSTLEAQHCLARVAGLHDEIKRSDAKEFVDINETYWKEQVGELGYSIVHLSSGSFGYKSIKSRESYNYGEYNYRGILGFNDLSSADIYTKAINSIASIKQDMNITSEHYFDTRNNDFMQENSKESEAIEDLRGVFFLLDSKARLSSERNITTYINAVFTAEFLERFELENPELTQAEKITKLQRKLTHYVGYDLRIISENEYNKKGFSEQGHNLLLLTKTSDTFHFRFFDSENNYSDYSIKNLLYLERYLNYFGWDDSKLSAHSKMDIVNDVVYETSYDYEESSNILQADLFWLNQQNIDAINSVYLIKADVDDMPYSYEFGLYYEPCKDGYYSFANLCFNNAFSLYFRPIGKLSAHHLKNLKEYNLF